MFGAPAHAQSQLPRVPAVTVTGEAEISAPPDMAEIMGGVTTTAKTAREASTANAKAMTAVMDALKAAGLAEQDLRTRRLSIFPTYDGSPSRLVGYRATNTIAVKLRDLGKVSEVVDAMVAAGANELGGINFMVTQASKLLDDARAQAIADARRKAEIYAKAAGVTLGTPISISEEGAAQPMFRAKMALPMAAAPSQIAQGEETLSITVGVTWAIKPAQ